MILACKVMLKPNNRQRMMKESELRKEFTRLRHLPEFRWLLTISNNVTKQAIKDCNRAFQNFFANRSEYPNFKSKRRGHYSFYQDTAKIQSMTA